MAATSGSPGHFARAAMTRRRHASNVFALVQKSSNCQTLVNRPKPSVVHVWMSESGIFDAPTIQPTAASQERSASGRNATNPASGKSATSRKPRRQDAAAREGGRRPAPPGGADPSRGATRPPAGGEGGPPPDHRDPRQHAGCGAVREAAVLGQEEDDEAEQGKLPREEERAPAAEK